MRHIEPWIHSVELNELTVMYTITLSRILQEDEDGMAQQ